MSLWHFIFYKADPTEVNMLIMAFILFFAIGVLTGLSLKEKK